MRNHPTPMNRIRPHSLRMAVAALAASALGVALVATAQPKAGRTAARRQTQTQTKNQPIHFGDIDISGYQTLGGSFGTYTRAAGPGTTVDAVDPKVPGAKSRIQASSFEAFMAPNTGGKEVDRVVATGSVRFSSTRPAKSGGFQNLTGTGTKVIYYKKQGRVELQGPVKYLATLTDKAGKVIQSADGDSASAEYSEGTEVLVLDGDVDVSVMVPGLDQPAKLTNAARLTLEMGKQPIEYHIEAGAVKVKPADTTPKKKP